MAEAARILPGSVKAWGGVRDDTHMDAKVLALMEAAARGHHHLLPDLIASGAPVDGVGDGTRTPLHEAAAAGHEKVVAALLEAGADEGAVSSSDEDKRPLHLACRSGCGGAVRRLLQAGADIEAREKSEWSPLHEASVVGDAEMVKLLAEAGANVNATGRGKWQAIHRAALWGYPEVIRVLLDKGADVEAKGVDDSRPIHYAAMRGHIEVLEALVQHDCDLHARDGNGATTLHCAAGGGQLETVKWLVMKNIPHNIGDGHNRTAEQIAQIYGYHQVKWWLHKQSADAPPNDHTQASTSLEEHERIGKITVRWAVNGDENLINSQIPSRPWRIHFQDTRGWTLLHHAAYHNKKKTAESLVNIGACKLALNFKGHTPADLAISRGHTEVAKLLMFPPADVNRSESVKLFGQLLKTISCVEMQKPTEDGKIQFNHHLRAVQDVTQLLSKGAPLEPVGGHTVYPLHLAISANCNDLLPLLLSAGAPLTSTTGGLGILQQAWLSPDVTTNVAVIVTRVVVYRMQYEKTLVSMGNTRSSKSSQCLKDGISHLLEELKGRQPWRASWPVVHNEKPSGTSCSSVLSTRPGNIPGTYQSNIHENKEKNNIIQDDTKETITHINKIVKTDDGDKDECGNDAGDNKTEPAVTEEDDCEDLTRLMVQACQLGATLTASFLMRSGASTTSTCGSSGQTALHAALDAGQLDTAATLVRHLGANIFLQDSRGRLPLTLCPMAFGQTLQEDALSHDYRVLDFLVSKARSNREKERMIHVVLLLALLYTSATHRDAKQRLDGDSCTLTESNREEDELKDRTKHRKDGGTDKQENCGTVREADRESEKGSDGIAPLSTSHNRNDHGSTWKHLFVRLASKFAEDDKKELVCDDWLGKFLVCLMKPGGRDSQGCTDVHIEGKEEERVFVGDEDGTLDKGGGGDGHRSENDHLNNDENLFFLLLEKLLKMEIKENDLAELSLESHQLIENTLLRALQISCENSLLSLIHLILTIAGVEIDAALEKVSGSTALHVAASHGRLGLCNFLLSRGASTETLDHAGRTPAHLAYMFGHSDAGDLLVHRVENVKDKANSCPRDLLSSFKNYMKIYTLDEKVKVQPQQQNDAMAMIRSHLSHLKWRCRGKIEKVVRRVHVNFTKGEAREVKETLTNELKRLLEELEKANPLFASNLHVLGSSADNLRLYAPDEFDCNVVLKNVSGFPGGGIRVTIDRLLDNIAQAKGYTTALSVKATNVELEDFIDSEKFVNKFFEALSASVTSFQPLDPRLSLVMPGIRKTQVGANVSFAWQGSEFPLLLIDVDLVPVVNIPWPDKLERPPLTPSSIDSVQITSTGDGNWRCSFSAVENLIFRELPERRRLVLLSCKLLIVSLKVESWATRDVKEQFTYWDGRRFKIPAPAGFILKSAFLREIEEVQDDFLWEPSRLMERMKSVFRRMCIMDDTSDKKSSSSAVTTHSDTTETTVSIRKKYFHGKIKAYFGGECEKATVGFSAPEILQYLESW